MAMVLSCPNCGAAEDLLYAEQDCTATYRVKAVPWAPDGIATTDEQIQGLKSWRLGCGECGEESDGGEFWTEGWLVDKGD